MTTKTIKTSQYRWNLSDLHNIDKLPIKVFSCFSGAGGSTMGYKRNGFNVIGALDIDPKQLELYKLNHNPLYTFCEDIREFNIKAACKELPEELYNLDILDGSPPCTGFSTMASWKNRQHLDINNIGAHKRSYYEGIVEQSIDDLYFHFIETTNILRPKCFITENVVGLTTGKAKPYLDKIVQDFKEIGYSVRYDILYGEYVGLPQKRHRVFIYGVLNNVMSQEDLDKLDFDSVYTNDDSALITFGQIRDDTFDREELKLNPNTDRLPIWEFAQQLYKENPNILLSRPNIMKKYEPHKKPSGYGSVVYKDTDVLSTMGSQIYVEAIKLNKPYYLNDVELCLASSFPLDYRFELNGQKACRSKLGYAIAMAVPPMMSQVVSKFVYDNILEGK